MTVSKTAVIGAGTMGIGIAHSLATGGFEVVLVDAIPPALDRAMVAIDENLKASVQRGKLSEEQARAARAHIFRRRVSTPPPRLSWSLKPFRKI